MISFLFPEDLDPRPSTPVQCTSPMSKKCRDAFPSYERIESTSPTSTAPSHEQTSPSQCATPQPPPPLISLPKPKKQPIISITSVNIGMDSSKHSRSGSLTRLLSLSRSKQERDEDRAARKRVKADKAVMKALPQLSPVVDEEFWRTGRYTEYRDQFAYVAF